MQKDKTFSDVMQFQYEGDASTNLKQATLKSESVQNLSLKRTLATGVLCSMIVIGGGAVGNTTQMNSNVQPPAVMDSTLKGSYWTSSGRKSAGSENVLSYTYTGGNVENVMSIPDQSAYAIEGANENWEAKEMLQKLMVKRDGLEKQGMYTGIIMSILILVLPLIFRTVSWGAIVPSAILSLSLTGFMYLRRQSRR